MELVFRRDLTAAETTIFEDQYEKPLRLPVEDKDRILRAGLACWLFIDEKLAGEAYGLLVRDMDEDDVPDLADRPDDVYCYSTTILPDYQGQGLGKILKAYWLAMVREQFPNRTIVGHATSPAMLAINLEFGAKVLARHDRWYDTDRTAWFYEIPAHPAGR